MAICLSFEVMILKMQIFGVFKKCLLYSVIYPDGHYGSKRQKWTILFLSEINVTQGFLTSALSVGSPVGRWGHSTTSYERLGPFVMPVRQ